MHFTSCYTREHSLQDSYCCCLSAVSCSNETLSYILSLLEVFLVTFPQIIPIFSFSHTHHFSYLLLYDKNLCYNFEFFLCVSCSRLMAFKQVRFILHIYFQSPAYIICFAVCCTDEQPRVLKFLQNFQDQIIGQEWKRKVWGV